MKKYFVWALCVVLTLSAALGCAGRKASDPWRPDNEILTYDRIDPDKTVIVAARFGNIYIDEFSAAFEALNPDVQVVCLDITGGDSKTARPVAEWIKNGRAPDVLFASGTYFSDEDTAAYFVDLSADPNVTAYEAEPLNRYAVNGRVYWLPGPSQIECMHYNKTLFEQYGWEVPATFDEFVALCLRIREDTDGAVQPWNPNAKYDAEFATASLAMVYEQLFAGVENRAWYDSMLAGAATIAGHMAPFYNMIQTLIDNGLLLEEHFSYSATTRGNEFVEGKIAMINYKLFNFESDDYEFGVFPFPTTEGDVGYLLDTVNTLVGVPKKEHTEAEADAIARYLAFFSSAEGQQAYIGNLLMVSNVKDVPLLESGMLSSLSPAIDAGHMVSRPSFAGPLGVSSFSACGDAKRMVMEGATAEECMAAVDAKPFRDAESAPADVPETVCDMTDEFTMLETSFLIADMYRERAGADIGLINHGVAYRGNLMRIFAGPFTTANLTVLKPRSFANDSTLVKAAMTGAQLLEALNHPKGNDAVSDSVYAYSGLKCTVAPWNPLGEKYLSVATADGKAIDPAALYTVAFWAGSVADEYITGTVETYEGAWEKHMSAKLAAGTIAPAHDGRIKLVWD